MGAGSGEGAGYYSGYYQIGQIPKDSRCCRYDNRHTDLGDVVDYGTYYADGPQVFFERGFYQEALRGEAHQTSGQTVGQSHYLAGKQAAQENPYDEYDKSVPRPQHGQGEEGHDVGKAELYSGYGGDGRDLSLKDENRQGDGGQDTHQRYSADAVFFLHRHYLPVTASTFSLSLPPDMISTVSLWGRQTIGYELPVILPCFMHTLSGQSASITEIAPFSIRMML